MTTQQAPIDREWKAETVRTLKEFLSWLCETAEHPERIYRGQSDAQWRLQANIDRNVAPDTDYARRLQEETELIDKFFDESYRFLGRLEQEHFRGNPADKVRKLTVMQHFGTPTRLLDWTLSAGAAAYFACIDECRRDGVVWWASHDAIVDSLDPHWEARGFKRYAHLNGGIDLNDGVFSPHVTEFVCQWYLKIPFSRAQAQRGLFTIGSRYDMLHDEQLAKQIPKGTYARVVIPANLKGCVIEYLWRLGIDAVSLQHAGADRTALRAAWARTRSRTTLG